MSINGLLVAADTNNEIEKLASAGTQSVLLVGKKGSGTLQMAKSLATRLLGLDSIAELDKYPYFYHLGVEAGKKEIAIEDVRRVVAATSLKIPSLRVGIKRVVLIENAENMSHEAQNALLKDLEEPSAATAYILTQDSGSELLPTIVSRCQRIVLKNPNRDEVLAHYTPGYEEREVLSAWSLAGGAQLTEELLKNEQHPLRLAAGLAKQFVAADRYGRLLIVSKLSDSKEDVFYFLDGLTKIAEHLIKSAAKSGDSQKLLNAGKMSKTSAKAQKMLEANTNTKLTLLWLATNF